MLQGGFEMIGGHNLTCVTVRWPRLGVALTAIICAGRLLRRLILSVAAAHRSSSMERARARAARCVPRCWHAGESEAAVRRRIRGSGAAERECGRIEVSQRSSVA